MSNATTWIERVKQWIDPLRAEPSNIVARVDQLRTERMLSRLRIMTPPVLLLQLLAMLLTAIVGADGGTSPARVRLIILAHALSVPIGLINLWPIYAKTPIALRMRRWMPLGAMVHASTVGVLLALAEQWNTGSTAELLLASVSLGIVLIPRGFGLFIPFVTTLLPLAILLRWTPASAFGRLNVLLNATTAVSVQAMAFRIGLGALLREVRALVDVETQKAELAASESRLATLNAELETRVTAQVGELREHTREVERLNLVLQQRVQEGAVALSEALKRLGQRAELQEGSVIDGRFELQRKIGSGGMGVVFEGYDRKSKSQVAIKLMDHVDVRDAQMLQRFVREAHAAASVNHPAVVKTEHIAVSSNGVLFQVQQLVRGIALDAMLPEGRRHDERHVAAIVAMLADALAAAHAKGITHRDVKPSNVMLSNDGRVYLLDFGVAKLMETPTSFERTLSGVVIGTPAYLAPEALMDSEHVGPPADLYAVGVLLFRMLFGRNVYERETVSALLAAHALDAVPDFRELGASDAMIALLTGLLAKDPATRPTATETRERLLAISADTTVRDAMAAMPAVEAEPQRTPFTSDRNDPSQNQIDTLVSPNP